MHQQYVYSQQVQQQQQLQAQYQQQLQHQQQQQQHQHAPPQSPASRPADAPQATEAPRVEGTVPAVPAVTDLTGPSDASAPTAEQRASSGAAMTTDAVAATPSSNPESAAPDAQVTAANADVLESAPGADVAVTPAVEVPNAQGPSPMDVSASLNPAPSDSITVVTASAVVDSVIAPVSSEQSGAESMPVQLD